MYGLIVRMVRERELAEDLAQEVFLKAYRALDTYDHQRKFSSWLFKIAHNSTIDHLRRSEIQTVPLEAESTDDRGLAACHGYRSGCYGPGNNDRQRTRAPDDGHARCE